MNFLTRFLKFFIILLLFSALGAFIFYRVVIAGAQLRSDVSQSEYLSTVSTVIGAWLGFIIFVSLLLALTGMKKTVSVPVGDRNTFLQRAAFAITSLRYRPSGQTENSMTFKPPALAFLAEKISVHLDRDGAIITAPRSLLGKIQERLAAPQASGIEH